MSASTEPVCPKCNGVGHVADYKTNTSTRCECVMRRAINEYLGPTFAGVEVRRADEVLKGHHQHAAIVRATSWARALPAIKMGLAHGFLARGGLSSFVKVTYQIVTDLDLRQSYMSGAAGGGSQHLAHLQNSQVVLKLGVSGHHKATALAVYEFLQAARGNALKDWTTPVWIVDTVSQPLREGHPSWSAELQQFLDAEQVPLIQLEAPASLSVLDALEQS